MSQNTLEWHELKNVEALLGAFKNKLNDREFCEKLIEEMQDFPSFSQKYGHLFYGDDDLHYAVWQVLIPDFVNVT